MKPTTKDAFQLIHDGTLALAEAERYGVAVDVLYCKKKLNHIARQTNRLESKILKEPELKLWKRKFGKKFNLNSDDQLRAILFGELGLKPTKYTSADEEKASVDKEVLGSIDIPFVRMMTEMKRIKTAEDDLKGILREQVKGLLHPNYTLHLVDTFRSSCQDPNLQNSPIRDPLQGKIVRTAFIPRSGHMLAEIDYGGIEVKTASWYHQDPTMLDYLHDSSKDMHRDMADQIYMIGKASPAYWADKTQGKIVRYCAKNKYVFPEFYGSYFGDCARNLWSAIDEFDLQAPGPISLKDHLKSKGISTYKKFEKHVEDVEADFWNNRFPVYQKWKKSWYAEYEKTGQFQSLTGFLYSGILRRNQVINYPVQGAAFHCLLWSFTRITQVAIQRGWRTRPVMQIHDSIILDMHPDEMNEVLEVCNDIMVNQLKKHWDFIITPLDVEIELTKPDQPWNKKREVHKMPAETCMYCGSNYMYYDSDGDMRCHICEAGNILPF